MGKFKMRKPNLKGEKSPFETEDEDIDTTEDVDTTLVDKVYAKVKVDEQLNKSGHHTEGDLRGKKISEGHKQGEEKILNLRNRLGASTFE